MLDLKRLQDKVLSANQINSFELILEIYVYQAQHNSIFRQFLKLIGNLDKPIHSLEDLCFLPIELFKSNAVQTGIWATETIFHSSGTTDVTPSSHYIESIDFYNKISRKCFEFYFGPLENFEFLALLPSYLERKDSSLVSMVSHFVNASNQFGKEVYFINEFEGLKKYLDFLTLSNKQIVLFGVSFALLDFAKNYQINQPNLTIIETGGMKGRHREIEKKELLIQLQQSFPNALIASEYGMTEMLSQAYALDGLNYKSHPRLKFVISDPTDPFSQLPANRRGIINVIDLANVHSCSFIQTGDLGVLNTKGELQVLGRHSFEELRGCSQLYE